MAFDEANIWLEQFKRFRSNNDPSGPADRPIWYIIGPTFYEISHVAMIIAGTRIRLRDRKILESEVAKIQGWQLIIHAGNEFRYLKDLFSEKGKTGGCHFHYLFYFLKRLGQAAGT